MSDWECTWSGRRWKHVGGGIVDRCWMLFDDNNGVKRDMFFCYKNEVDFYAGNNFTTKTNLRSAKAAIESNVKNGDE